MARYHFLNKILLHMLVKYVNVFRAVRVDERVDAQTFKIPKTGQANSIFLSELKLDVEYR